MSCSKKYSIAEAAKVCGITSKQIWHWEKKKYLQESTSLRPCLKISD